MKVGKAFSFRLVASQITCALLTKPRPKSILLRWTLDQCEMGPALVQEQANLRISNRVINAEREGHSVRGSILCSLTNTAEPALDK